MADNESEVWNNQWSCSKLYCISVIHIYAMPALNILDNKALALPNTKNLGRLPIHQLCCQGM